MSVEAMSWALNVPIGGTPKLVLIGLANHATAQFTEAWPAVTTLATYAHCDRRTVQRALRKLEDEGWIAQTGAHPVKGRHDRVTYVYRLTGRHFAAPYGAASEDGAASTPERGGASVANGAAPTPPEPSLENRPKENRPPAASAHAREALPDDFPPSMRPPLTEVVTTLSRIAAARGVQPPSEVQIARAMMKRPLKPWMKVADDLEDWLVYGKGKRASAANIVQRWRTWCDGEDDVPPGGTVTQINPRRRTSGTNWTARDMWELGQEAERAEKGES